MCERERWGHSAAVYVCVCVCERGRHGHITTAASSLSVTRLCSPLGLELMVKLRTLLTVFTFILRAKARNYGKGRYISDAACGVRPITMHCSYCTMHCSYCSAQCTAQLANQSRLCLLEGGTL